MKLSSWLALCSAFLLAGFIFWYPGTKNPIRLQPARPITQSGMRANLLPNAPFLKHSGGKGRGGKSKMQGQYFYSNSGNTRPAISSFTLYAPNLYDGSLGDTSTGYLTGANNYLFVAVDFGSPQTISGYELVMQPLGYGLYGSNDGTTWAAVPGANGSGTGTTPGTITAITPVTYRYILLQCNGLVGRLVTDFRLYDSTGAVVTGQTIPVTAGTSFPAQTGVSTLFGASGKRSAASLAARTAAIVLLTSAGGAGVITPAPRSLPPVLAVNRLLMETGNRGAASLAPRRMAVSLLSEQSPSAAQALPPVTASAETLLSSSCWRGAATYAERRAAITLLFTEVSRAGPAASAGSTHVPFIGYTGPLISATGSRGPIAFASRTGVSILLSESAPIQPRSLAGRTVIIHLLSASARAGQVISAPLPEAVDTRDPFEVLRSELLYLASLKGGSPVAFADTLLAILDNLAASYRTNELNLSANTLMGLPVLIRGGDGSPGNTGYGFGQDTPILELLPAAEQLIADSVPAKILDGRYRPIFTKIDAVLISMGYASLNVYLTSLNTAAPGTYLVHPNAALLYYLYKNQQGALLLSPGNVFAPQTAFGLGTVGAGGSIAYTDLSSIPAANMTSPTPGMSTQGYTGAKGIALLVTTAVNGTLTVSATTASGVTWTANLDNKAAGQTVLMTPGTAGVRVYDVTGITGSGAATAGAFQVNSVIERAVG